VSGYTNLPQFDGGFRHSAAIKDDLTMLGTGYNSNGQLGKGDSGAGSDTNSFVASVDAIPEDGKTDYWDIVVCGELHSAALKVVESVAATINDDEEPQVWRLE